MDELRDVTIASRIAARARGDASPEEEALLEEWLAESEGNRQLYERLMDGERRERRLAEYDERSLEGVKGRVRRRVARRMIVRRAARVASVVFLPLLLAVGWYLTRESPVEVSLLDKVPGGGQVVLELADGRRLDLVAPGELEGTTARKDSCRLTYPSSSSVDEGYNVLLTARGGEYGLALSDGTRVWMNAESRLRYPVVFSGETREVELEGEAYFDVAKGAAPFRVHARGATVEALGTSFNVMGYANEEAVEATLVSGKARVSRGEEAVILSPGEQARVEAGGIATRTVNAAVYASWKENLFTFDDESLEVIARKLSRWYDVEIEIASPSVRSATFYGVLPKYATISVFLERMKQVYDMEYAIDGKRIVLK
ncbi:MAG: FecR family protein [Odoribacteraceae bacterium]|jgi:ferric-dicitrate binding protein FerR (iron transport regulator)|nr:FecR family protein [Odoribacteraceae bacterium]